LGRLSKNKLGRSGILREQSSYLVELFPFPRHKHNHWEEAYSKLLPNEVDSLTSFVNWVIGARIEFLRGVWETSNPDITICMGSTRFIEYRWLFDLIETPRREGNVFYFEKKRVIITPFFDYRKGMPTLEIEKLISKLKANT